MNMKELKELIELVSEKGFAEFEVERQGFRLRISRFKEPRAQIIHPAAAPMIMPPMPVAYDLPASADTRDASQPEPATATRADQATAQAGPPRAAAPPHIIKSPIVGTFYRASSPSTPPFVKVGDRVEPETVVCIIEAMKLMNEIQAETSGEVVEIYVENGQPVEYGQPLFGVKP